MEIKTEVIQIEKIINYYFIIPSYQREYSWKAESHVSKLYEDITSEFVEKESISSQNSYFIGTIIIVKRPDGDYEIVDGQQRLTTIILLLIALREQLQNIYSLKESDKIKEEVLKKLNSLLYNFDLGTSIRKPRIKLMYEEGMDYLDSLITRRIYGGVQSNYIKRLKESYNFLVNCIADISENHLINFISYVLLKVEMAIIIPENIVSSLKIFETMNQRGTSLNSMDLLKSIIFKDTKIFQFDKVKTIWQEIIKNLEMCGEGDKPIRFLRYLLMGRYFNGVIREEDIYKYIVSDEGIKVLNYVNEPILFIEELRDKSILYRDFVNATKSESEDANYPYLTFIGYMGKKNIRLHLILLLALNDHLIRDKNAINLLLRNLEILLFYSTFSKDNKRNFDKKIASWAKELRKVTTHEDLKVFIAEYITLEIKNLIVDFDVQFKSLKLSDIKPLYRIKYFLGRIENFVRDQGKLPTHEIGFYQSLQIEHISPQKPEDYKFPNEYKNKSEYDLYLEMLGNITLIESSINQSLNKKNKLTDNNWFIGKINEYINSDFKLTQTISNIEKIGVSTLWNQFAFTNLRSYSNWNKDSIQDRQEMLLELVKKVWKPLF